MTSARSTRAAAMSARIASMRPCSSGNARWQCESTNMAPLWRLTIAGLVARTPSDRLRGFGRLQLCAQDLFDLELQQARLLVVGETHANALGAAARCIGRRDPRHLSGHRVALRII